MLRQVSRKSKRIGRKRRVRAKLVGSASRPRLSVFRSLKSLSVQAIDDRASRTIGQANLGEVGGKVGHTVAGAAAVGKLIAKRLLAAGVSEAILDRSGYRYHGKVKALAEGAREGGLKI